MFTYSLQKRQLRGTSAPRFPAMVALHLEYAPSIPFGVGAGPSATVFGAVSDKDMLQTHDAFTGRVLPLSTGPGAIEMEVRFAELVLKFAGPRVETSFLCKDEEVLASVVTRVAFALPLFLGIHLCEPVSATSATCIIDGEEYSVELGSPWLLVIETTAELQRQRMTDALRDATTAYSVDPAALRPLLTSLHYYHQAQRLLAAGASAWEFMPEAILNYSKALEALWGNSTDEIRNGLQGLEVDQGQIEGVFIPVFLLRNHVDVGHVRYSRPPQVLLDRLYPEIECIQVPYLRMYSRLFGLLRDGKVPYKSQGAVPPSHFRDLEGIVESLERGPKLASGDERLVYLRVTDSADQSKAP